MSDWILLQEERNLYLIFTYILFQIGRRSNLLKQQQKWNHDLYKRKEDKNLLYLQQNTFPVSYRFGKNYIEHGNLLIPTINSVYILRAMLL